MYTNTVFLLIMVLLLFVSLNQLPADPLIGQGASFNLTSLTETTNATDGFVNVTIPSSISALIEEKVENETRNVTANVLKNISNISTGVTPPATTNASVVNATTVINSIFTSNLPALFIIVIFLAIVIPLVFDMYLAYLRRPKEGADKGKNVLAGMPGLYRSLMAFGIILLVGTVIFYLLALITLNLNNPSSVLQSLVDILRDLGIILGTALATIIAFYFGVRGAESAVEKAAKAMVLGEKVPPKVISTSPSPGAPDVPVNSLVQATFSEPMNSATINKNTFTVKKEGETTPLEGKISLSPDGKTASFDPEQDFSAKTTYSATIETGAQDLAGNTLDSSKRWSFTTK